MGLSRKWSDGGRRGKKHPADPDPTNFKIIDSKIVGGYTCLVVIYPNCTTFGGKKFIILLGEYSSEKLASIKTLDPHFLDKQDPIIVARIRPDEAGMNFISALGEKI